VLQIRNLATVPIFDVMSDNFYVVEIFSHGMYAHMYSVIINL